MEARPSKSTKKSSSSSSSSKRDKEEKKEREREKERERMDDSAQEEEAPPKEKKKKSKKEKSAPVDIDQAQANSPSSMSIDIEASSTTTSSSSTHHQNVTKTPINNNINNGVNATPISMTPLKSLLGLATTPMASPSRASISRLKERDDLILLNSKLRDLLAAVEQKESEIQRLRAETITNSRQATEQINLLNKRLEEAESQFDTEYKLSTELKSQVEVALSDIRAKDEQHQADIESIEKRMGDTINSITEENNRQVVSLRSELNKKVVEIETLKGDVKQLNSELITRGKEHEDKSRKLLDAEYTRMKSKEEELRNLITQRESDIKKLKIDLKEKEKLVVSNQRKEAELQQTIEAYERQAEDMRDSVNREWEIKCAQLVEEQNSRLVTLEMSVNNFNDERETFKSQLHVTQGQVEELNVKNHELLDTIDQLNQDIKSKNATIAQISTDLEEIKKAARRIQAESKKKDSTIALLQDEINGKEVKCGTYQSEIGKLRKDLIIASNANNDPDIPLTREIDQLKSLVYGFEKRVQDDDRKRKRARSEAEDSNPFDEFNGGENGHDSEMGDQLQQQQPEENKIENTIQLNTVSLLSIDAAKECIRLTVSGDFENGMSINGWKLIVTKPDKTRIGFSFPENAVPMRGLHIVTVWTGRVRPQNVQTPDNEFYWSRQNIWDAPENTLIKLIAPSDDVITTITLAATGVYQKDNNDSKNPSNCLIM